MIDPQELKKLLESLLAQRNANEDGCLASLDAPNLIHAIESQVKYPIVVVKDENIVFRYDLNHLIEDLLPSHYLHIARERATGAFVPWCYRNADNLSEVNFNDWPADDQAYKKMFEYLAECPSIEKGLWEGGSESLDVDSDMGSSQLHGRMLRTLLDDICQESPARCLVMDENKKLRGFFLETTELTENLRSRTGFKQMDKEDSASTSICGVLAIRYYDPDSEFEEWGLEDSYTDDPVLNMSTTTNRSSLTEALPEKTKQIVAQLHCHLYDHLRRPGRVPPDQEIFQIGVFGTKLHILRAWFPGHQVSSIWCHRFILRKPKSSSILAGFGSIRVDSDLGISGNVEGTDGAPIRVALAETYDNDSHTFSAESSPARPGAENASGSAAAKQFRDDLAKLNRESGLDLKDVEFQVQASREYDLKTKDGFLEARLALMALHNYLLSGHAKCNLLQGLFDTHSFEDFYTSEEVVIATAHVEVNHCDGNPDRNSPDPDNASDEDENESDPDNASDEDENESDSDNASDEDENESDPDNASDEDENESDSDNASDEDENESDSDNASDEDENESDSDNASDEDENESDPYRELPPTPPNTPVNHEWTMELPAFGTIVDPETWQPMENGVISDPRNTEYYSYHGPENAYDGAASPNRSGVQRRMHHGDLDEAQISQIRHWQNSVEPLSPTDPEISGGTIHSGYSSEDEEDPILSFGVDQNTWQVATFIRTEGELFLLEDDGGLSAYYVPSPLHADGPGSTSEGTDESDSSTIIDDSVPLPDTDTDDPASLYDTDGGVPVTDTDTSTSSDDSSSQSDIDGGVPLSDSNGDATSSDADDSEVKM